MILMSPESSPDEIEGLVNDERDALLSRKGQYQKYAQMLTKRVAYINGRLSLTPDWYTEVKSIILAENRQSVEFELRRLCGMKGFQVMDRASLAKTKSDDLAAASKQVKEDADIFDRSVYDLLLTADLKSCISVFQQRVIDQTATHQMKAVLGGARVLIHYPVESMSYDDYVMACKKRQQIVALCCAKRYSAEDCSNHDAALIIGNDWHDETIRIVGEKRTTLLKSVHLLGFNGLFDVTTHADADKCDLHSEAIMYACRTSCNARRARKPRSTSTKVVLNAELKAVYGIKLTAANSHDSSHLKLLLDADLMRLARISDYFTRKQNGQVQPTVDNTADILPL